jgi:hypothetical protein
MPAGKVVHETASQPTAGFSGVFLSSLAMQEVQIGKIVLGQLGKK